MQDGLDLWSCPCRVITDRYGAASQSGAGIASSQTALITSLAKVISHGMHLEKTQDVSGNLHGMVMVKTMYV